MNLPGETASGAVRRWSPGRNAISPTSCSPDGCIALSGLGAEGYGSALQALDKFRGEGAERTQLNVGKRERFVGLWETDLRHGDEAHASCRGGSHPRCRVFDSKTSARINAKSSRNLQVDVGSGFASSHLVSRDRCQEHPFEVGRVDECVDETSR